MRATLLLIVLATLLAKPVTAKKEKDKKPETEAPTPVVVVNDDLEDNGNNRPIPDDKKHGKEDDEKNVTEEDDTESPTVVATAAPSASPSNQAAETPTKMPFSETVIATPPPTLAPTKIPTKSPALSPTGSPVKISVEDPEATEYIELTIPPLVISFTNADSPFESGNLNLLVKFVDTSLEAIQTDGAAYIELDLDVKPRDKKRLRRLQQGSNQIFDIKGKAIYQVEPRATEPTTNDLAKALADHWKNTGALPSLLADLSEALAGPVFDLRVLMKVDGKDTAFVLSDDQADDNGSNSVSDNSKGSMEDDGPFAWMPLSPPLMIGIASAVVILALAVCLLLCRRRHDNSGTLMDKKEVPEGHDDSEDSLQAAIRAPNPPRAYDLAFVDDESTDSFVISVDDTAAAPRSKLESLDLSVIPDDEDEDDDISIPASSSRPVAVGHASLANELLLKSNSLSSNSGDVEYL